MPTIAELRSIIRGQLTGQVPFDDVRLRDRWLDELMNQQRSLLISQYGRGTGIPQSYYQIIDCIKVECGQVECAGMKSGVMYHYATIPTVSSIRDAIAYLGPVDGSLAYLELSVGAFNASSGRFGRKPPGYTLIQDKALLKDLYPANIKKLRMIAVLYNPSQGLCGGSVDDLIYPIDDEDIGKLTTLCIKQVMSTINIKQDMQNDAVDAAPVEQKR